jgi:hypothetical protein
MDCRFEAAVNVIRSLPKKGGYPNLLFTFLIMLLFFVLFVFLPIFDFLNSGSYQPPYETMLKVRLHRS